MLGGGDLTSALDHRVEEGIFEQDEVIELLSVAPSGISAIHIHTESMCRPDDVAFTFWVLPRFPAFLFLIIPEGTS